MQKNGVSDRNSISTKPRDLSVMGEFFYYGGDYVGSTLDLIPKGAPFRIDESFSVPCYSFSNKSSAQNWHDLMEFSYEPHLAVGEDGEIGFVVSTARNKFYVTAEDIAKYGAVFNPRDENMARMDGWIGSTEGSHAIEYAKVPKFKGLVVSRHEHQPDPVMRKFVTDLVDYEGPLNDLGKYLSKAETLRQDWNNYFQSKEGNALASEKSGDDAGIQYLGITSVEGVLYAIGKLQNGKIILLSGDKAYDGLSAEAALAKVRLGDRRIAALGEEAMHHYRRSYDTSGTLEQFIAEETETKAELLCFYKRLATGAESKPQLKATYSKIVDLIRRDIGTVRERYTASWKRIHSSREASDLELVLMAEAYAIGLETDKEVRDYIASKLAESGNGDNENKGTIKNKSASLKSGNESGKERGHSGDSSGDSGEKTAYAIADESGSKETREGGEEEASSNDASADNSGGTE